MLHSFEVFVCLDRGSGEHLGGWLWEFDASGSNWVVLSRTRVVVLIFVTGYTTGGRCYPPMGFDVRTLFEITFEGFPKGLSLG